MAGLKDSFSKGLTTINVKASNFMEQNKLKTYISTLESDIEKLKTVIGRKSYDAWSVGAFSQEMILQELEAIKEKYATIEKTKVEIAELEEKEKQILGNGAAENQQASQPQYQQNPQQFQQTPATDMLFCPKCRNPYKPGYKFCEKCGTKLD